MVVGANCLSVELIGVDAFATWPLVILPKAKMRTGQGVDFAVNAPGSGPTEIRFVVHDVDPSTSKVSVRVIQCLEQMPMKFGCATMSKWGAKNIPGQQFQPTIALVDKDPSGLGLAPQWSYAIYNDGLVAQPPGADQRLRPVQVLMQSGGMSFRTSADSSTRVCPAYYPGRPYWGDYFGYTGFQRDDGAWLHVAAFSHDMGQGCQSFNIWQGNHLHVAATSWADP